MRKGPLLCCLAAGFALCGRGFAKQAQEGVQVITDQAHRRVDVTVNGQPFTSYIWPVSLKKPVLFPLIAADGTVVTRGYPLAPRAGERTDHPHHAGMWLNYGNVNGFDFWNNSDAIKPENRDKMGTIYQEKIVSTRSGRDSGKLTVDSIWITGKNQKIIQETTRYVFRQDQDERQGERQGERTIDEITTLRALDRVVFNDDKEGLLGIRVARFLESPTAKGGVFTDASGRKTTVAGADAPGATGVYLTSDGKKGDAVWGTRGRWCTLTGSTGKKTLTIAILDHPKNPGYPTYWHARGYGLFAANPLARSIFDPKLPAMNFTLQKNQSVTFRYRIILFARAASPAEIKRDADVFAADYP